MGEGWKRIELFFFLILFFERSLEYWEENDMKFIHVKRIEWKVSKIIFSQLKVDRGRNDGDLFEIDSHIVVFTFTLGLHSFKNDNLNKKLCEKYINISKLNYSFQFFQVCLVINEYLHRCICNILFIP